VILHQIRLPRAADEVDLSGLTTAVRTEPARWVECDEHDTNDCLIMPLDDEPTLDEQVAIRRRLVAVDDADEARLHELIALRAAATTPFEVMWLDTELAKYGES
jgi:hypothetical protein